MLRGAHHLVVPATAIRKFSNDGFSPAHTLFYGGAVEERKQTSTEKETGSQEATGSDKKDTHKHGKAEGRKKSPPGT